jgi:SAM-dependent methyltransferase
MDFLPRGFDSREHLKNHIIMNGCYSREENEQIYQSGFCGEPRYIFRAVNEKYHLVDRMVCDVGCGYGAHLFYFKAGSYGIDREANYINFAKSIGLEVFQRDVINDDLTDLPQVEAIWNNAVLEHVESPHILLRKMHMMLKADGILAIYVPTIPPIPFLKYLPRLGRYFSGYLHGDHINAFTPQTLQFFCERAGFETIEVSSFYPPPLSIISRGLFLLSGCVYIGKKNQAWEYPLHSIRRNAVNAKGFQIVGESKLPD